MRILNLIDRYMAWADTKASTSLALLLGFVVPVLVTLGLILVFFFSARALAAPPPRHALKTPPPRDIPHQRSRLRYLAMGCFQVATRQYICPRPPPAP
jgi:hypothetical protein